MTAAASGLGPHSIPHVDPSLLPVLFAILLSVLAPSHSDDGEDEEGNDTLHSPPWVVTDFSAAGKGFGAVAARDIPVGERLIAERPVCVWPQGLSPQRARELFSEMDEGAQKVFMDLARTEGPEIDKMDDILAKRATNGFALPLPPTPVSGPMTVAAVFPRIARVNHSCLPNASQAINLQTLRMEVFATTPIPRGTEINIPYLALITNTAAERSAALKEHFGFAKCMCRLCAADEATVRASDARRLEMRGLVDGVMAGAGDRKGTVAKMERIAVLVEEEGYQGLPEFEDPNVTNSFAVYWAMRARRKREEALA